MDYFNQESKRLIFRKLTLKDISAWALFFKENNRIHFLGIDTSKSDLELATDWVLRQLQRYSESGFGHLAVIKKTTHEFVGMGGIIPRIVDGKKEFEIAYSILPEYWNKGFATEIAQQLKRFGLSELQLPRMISIIAVNNDDSVNVARKNGMKLRNITNYLGMEVEVYAVESCK